MMVEMSSVVNGVAAGMSQVFGALLKAFFDPAGLDKAKSGMKLPIEGFNIRLFAKVELFCKMVLPTRPLGTAREMALPSFACSAKMFHSKLCFM